MMIAGFVRWATPESDPWITPAGRFTEAAAMGRRLAVVDELQLPDSGWELGGEGRPCRRLARPACPNPSVATLGRGSKTPQRWGYCAEHLYGRYLEDGRLLTTVLVVDKDSNV